LEENREIVRQAKERMKKEKKGSRKRDGEQDAEPSERERGSAEQLEGLKGLAFPA